MRRPSDNSGMSGEEVRALRWRLGLTQVDLGNELGVTEWTVLRWERGKATVRQVYERAMHDLERTGARPLQNPAIRWNTPHWVRFHDPATGLPVADRSRRKD